MPFATIAGVTYEIQYPGAQSNQDDSLGQVRRGITGGARNSTRAVTRSWSMTLLPIPVADYDTFYAAVKGRAFVTCVGDFTGGASLLCWVEINSTPFFRPSVIYSMMRAPSITVYEVDPQDVPFTPLPFSFLLTSVVSPDDAAAKVSTPDGFYPGDAGTSAALGAALVPPTAACPALPATVFSSAAEIKFLSVPLMAGYVFGKPSVRIEVAAMDPSVWQHGSIMSKLYLKRAGSLVAGPWLSNYVGTSFAGSTETMVFADTLSLALLDGDQFLLEFWIRLALDCGKADNGQRPTVFIGAVPGPRLNPLLFLTGDIHSL